MKKNTFAKLSVEIHNIWTEINLKSIPNVYEKVANSILEYDELIERVNPLILKCHNDFGITLKREISPEFKEGIIKLLGNDFYNKNFGE